jgi:LDH2 family malate/lactate/ureidoglycolate dehydrogenase
MTTRVPVDSLREFITALFRAAGVPDEDAGVCAGAFLLQEMRGVKTHGLRRLRGMLDQIRHGEINATPQRRVLHEDGATIIIDGDRGLGILCCMDAMEQAVRLAKGFGIGFSIVVNSNHFLAAAPYCLRAAEAGVIGLAFANGNSGMAYPGTNVGALGNSPVGFALPTGAGFPIVFDAALTLSGGKLIQWAKEGVRIPDGFLGYDADGNFSSDPAAVSQGGVPLPIGLHKGAGLGILIDVLTGVIANSTFLRTLVPAEHPDWRRTTNTHSFIAIDIERFMPLDLFRERMAAYVADLKSKPLAAGYEEILLPGERAARSIEDCRLNGVPVDDDVLARLAGYADDLGVQAPFSPTNVNG